MIPEMPRRRFRFLSLVSESESDMPRSGGGLEAIYIRKTGMGSGPYSLVELHEALASNKASASDLAWHKGLVGWTPLSTILNPARIPLHAPGSASEPRRVQFYERLHGIVLNAVTELFGELGGSDTPLVLLGDSNELESFMDRFPRKAADFITHCSTSVAAEVRRSTHRDSVMSVPTGRLAMEAREAAFKEFDHALRRWRVNPGRTREYGEQLFTDFVALLRTLSVPLVEWASAKCFDEAFDRREHDTCMRVITLECNNSVNQATRRFAEAFAGCDSYERQVARFAQLQQKKAAGMKAGCVAAPASIAVLVVVLVTTADRLSQFMGTAICFTILILLLACCSNLLKLLGLWL